jgi:hypothetical protein
LIQNGTCLFKPLIQIKFSFNYSNINKEEDIKKRKIKIEKFIFLLKILTIFLVFIFSSFFLIIFISSAVFEINKLIFSHNNFKWGKTVDKFEEVFGISD